jgi:predicted AAA+ superfamily ATPase
MDFKFEGKKALELGCLPEPYLATNRSFSEKLLRSYVGTYLQEEILAESLVRQVHGFSRFLNVAAENSGKLLDFSKFASKSKVNRSAARRFYEILEDTLICDKVDPYFCEDADMVKHPKYYLFDIGVVNGLLGNFIASPDRIGLLFEHLFFNQLKNTSYSIDKDIKISHFRTRGGLEVDFIVEIDGRIVAVELKVSEPSNSELLPLKMLDQYIKQPVEKYVACLNVKPKKIQEIEILDWQTVIRKIFIK